VVAGLKRLASELGRVPTSRDLVKARPYCPTIGTIVRLCGSLGDALRDAGFPPHRSRGRKRWWTPDRCVRALRQAAAQTGGTLTRSDVARLKKAGAVLPSASLLARRFGSFAVALAAAGIGCGCARSGAGAEARVGSRLDVVREAAAFLRDNPGAAEAMRSVAGERAFTALALYVRLGRLEDVGAAMGVSRQRAHQLVVKAARCWMAARGIPSSASANGVLPRVDPAWGIPVVRLERMARGITQEGLAQAAGVSVRTVRRMENGLRVTGPVADAVAAFLGRRTDELFETCGEREEARAGGG
jgi:DNA-binding XRE family transcriptional regulator